MAKPPSEMRISGRLGPWRAGDAESTAVSGDYLLEHADLGAFQSLAGTVTSRGKLEGTLGRLAIAGHVEIPNFEVKSSGHAVPLTAEFRAAINALNGAIALQEVRAHFGATTVLASGDIARHPASQPRTATLQLAVRNGTAQDILGLFTHGPRAPMSGPASLQARATLSGGQVRFLRRLRMEGDFAVDPGDFTSPHMQQSMDVLSEKARGDKNARGSERVADDLRGHAVIENGIVNFSRVSFRVPGALAYVHGTYDLRTKQVNLHGTLKMDAQLSQATRGAKSVLLKALSPFLKKNEHGGAVVPFRITGTSGHPVYQASPVKGQAGSL